MPKLETVIIAHETLVKVVQDHKRVISWYNIPPSKNFFSEVYSKSTNYDIFGIVPHPFCFARRSSLSVILNLFNKDPATNAVVLSKANKEGPSPIFINRKLFDPSSALLLKEINDYCKKRSLKIYTMEGIFKTL
tara:strand:- start:22891 stop:23292 length:402 start_codon:yes stop_codon:yes gene_type:complete